MVITADGVVLPVISTTRTLPFVGRPLAIASLGVVLALPLAAPSADATGWLVNVEAMGWHVKYGANPAGTTGDFLDVGVMTWECSDEQDVIDVGVMNTEGVGSCGWNRECASESAGPGRAYLPVVGARALGPDLPRVVLLYGYLGEEPEACSDNGDVVDVGVLNDEGHFKGDYERGCVALARGPAPSDLRDAVDLGILNRECQDREDVLDVGIANCEYDDRHDTVDVGVMNFEFLDAGDLLDVAISNAETGEDSPSPRNVDVEFLPPIPCLLNVLEIPHTPPLPHCVTLPDGRPLCVRT